MTNAARRYCLYVNEIFMKRAKSFIATVVKKALGIDHYWGRVEFAPRREVLQDVKHVVPMEITFMDNGGKYNLYNEFADVNSHI